MSLSLGGRWLRKELLRGGGLILLGVLAVCACPLPAAAVWNGQLYNPGVTLDPECDPSQVNCDVIPPANSGINTNIAELHDLTTPLRADEGGTGLSGLPAGALVFGSGGPAMNVLAAGSTGQLLAMGAGGQLAWINPAAGTAYSAGAGLTLSGTAFAVDEGASHDWTGPQTFSGGLSVGGDTFSSLTGPGLGDVSGALTLDLGSLATQTTSAGADRLAIYDQASGTSKTITIANLLAPGSGGGLELTGSALSLLQGCGSGQLLKWNGSAWGCANDIDTDTNTTYSAGTGLSLSGTTFSINTAASLTYTGVPTYQNGVVLGSDTVTDITGAGLSVNAGTLKLDPGGLGTTSSFGSSDQLLLYNPNTQTTVRIAATDLLAGVTGSLNYQGTWNANTDTPDLTAACTSAHKGWYYVVSVAGGTSLSGAGPWAVNDWAVCNGASWQRVQTSNAVASVFGRTGAVVAASGDYNAGQVTNTPAGGISSTTVQGAVNELDAEKYGAGANASLSGLSVSTGADRHTLVASFASTDGATSVYATNATPEGDVTAARGALAIDSTAGKVYIKTTVGGNTGWSELATTGVCSAGGCNFSGATATVTNTTTDGALVINSNGNGALTLDSTGNGAVNIGTGGTAQTTTIGGAGGSNAVVINAGSGGLTVNAASALTGGVAVAGTTQLAGAEVHPAAAISNQASDGAIGTAAATVDAHSYFTVAQTTSGRTLSLPSPTTTTAGQLAYVSNTGSASFVMQGQTLAAGGSAAFVWNGSAWTVAGTTTPPTICTTTGCTFTGGASTVQTTSGNSLSVVTDTTGALTLDSGTTGAVNLGTGSNAKTVTVGNGTGGSALVLTAGTGGLSASSAVATATAHSFTANAVTSGTALALSANGLTSGNGLAVTSSSTALTGNLGYIALTGNSASNTGNLLYLNSSGVSSLATGLKISIAGSGLGALIDGSLALPSVSYTSTGTQNNVAFSKSTSTVRLNPASALTITGVVAGVDGQLLTLWNASGQLVILNNNNAGSSAGNRFATSNGADLPLEPGASATMQYDGSSTVWRVVSRPYVTPSTLMATTSTAQTTGLSTNSPIKFDTVTSITGSDITLNTGTFTFNVKANHTYQLSGQLNTASFSVLNTNAFVLAAWYDTTATATQIGQSCTTLSVTDTLLGSGGSPVCSVMFSPTVDSTVQLRITGVSGLTQIGSSGGQPTAILQELGGN